MKQQMMANRNDSYVEILEILKHMDKVYVNKIPKKLIEFFEDNKSRDYQFKYNSDLELDKQILNVNTLALLAMLNLNYWCENKEHRNELIDKYNKNEQKYQEELREKYNPDDIFKNKSKNIETDIDTISASEKVQLVEYKEEKWYQKIFSRILNLFRR